MKYLSLFTGIGGFELGIKQAYEKLCIEDISSLQKNRGEEREKIRNKERQSKQLSKHSSTRLSCIGYSEIDKYACQIYEKHFKHKNYGDITKINVQELPDFDFLVGGFPCQAFSIAGKRKGFDDTRGTLFFDIARILSYKKPRCILLENVKGLLSHDGGKTFQTILGVLTDLGYFIEWQVLNSKNFGVPQNRERVFIIGHLGGERRPKVFPIGQSNKKFIRETNKQGCTNTLTGRSAGGQNRRGNYIKQLNKPKHSNDRVYSEKGVSPTLNTAQGGRRQPFIRALDLYNKKAHKDRTPCLTEPHHNSLRLQVDSKIRRLTPIECERLQGFPDNWTEGVSDTQRYKTLGNAVTVNVIKEIMLKL